MTQSTFDSKCSFLLEHNYENISYDQQIWRRLLNLTYSKQTTRNFPARDDITITINLRAAFYIKKQTNKHKQKFKKPCWNSNLGQVSRTCTTHQSLPSSYRSRRLLRLKNFCKVISQLFCEFQVFKASFAVILAPKRHDFLKVLSCIETRQNAN